jgi:DNA-binding NtrC family response regulator
VRTALITGDTGTGKELVARALHKLGPRSSKRFVTVNCSAVVETLFESELFGHVRGAFTGATDHKAGLFETADGGTLFLDEVGELPLPVQAKLLRVLEEGEVQRVGSLEPKKIDVRLIAATNRDLLAEVSSGRFRNDLYYRLNIVEVRLPLLRDRREDIPYLTAAFVRSFSQRFDKPLVGLTPGAERLLADAGWDGNVRQLRNVIERACILAETDFVGEGDLAGSMQEQTVVPAVAVAAGASTRLRSVSNPAPLVEVEREHIVRTLHQVRGNKAVAARLLGISRRAFYRQLERHGLHQRIPMTSRAESLS